VKDAAIALHDVSLTLGEGASAVKVLDRVSLEVAAGEAVGIVGPSGSGKSTLLMVLAGLERIDSGTIRIAGQSLAGKNEDWIASFRGRNIGIVFQSFHLIPNMTALENVAVPLELAGHADPFGLAAAELSAVGLAGRFTHYPGELSGGEQQRVAIARALAPAPHILIADEPTGNLDQATGAQVADLLFAKAAERGTTLVLVTHDPALAARCGRQVAMRSGRIVEDAAPARLASA
jgi:putative ABC transport system ATP-binding protein